MNCQEVRRLAGDAVDGVVDAAAARRIDEHAAACPECRALLADLRAIRTAARGLPGHAPPERVWAAVRSSLRDAGAAGKPAGGLWQGLAAAALLVLLAGGLGWIGAKLTPLAGNGGHRLAVAAAIETAEDVESQYAPAIAGLEAIAAGSRDSLDAETAEVLQANLAVIDQAIDASRAALEVEPASPLAIESLLDSLRSKLALLEDMVALINEMRKGNEEGAARIVSELNQ